MGENECLLDALLDVLDEDLDNSKVLYRSVEIIEF